MEDGGSEKAAGTTQGEESIGVCPKGARTHAGLQKALSIHPLALETSVLMSAQLWKEIVINWSLSPGCT